MQKSAKINLDKINIRESSINDLKEIIFLLSEDDELGKTRESGIINDEIPECYLKAYLQIKDSRNCMLIVAEYNNEIIALLQIIFIPTLTYNGTLRAEVEGVRVKSNYRSLGIGRLMFQYVKELAITKKCGLIQLTTNKSRIDAQKFYKSIGFIDSHCGMKIKLC